MDRSVSVRSLLVSAAVLMLPLQSALANGNQWRAVSASPMQAMRGVVVPSLGVQDRRFRPVRAGRPQVQLRAPASAVSQIAAQPAWVNPQQPVLAPAQMMPVQTMRPVQAVQPMYYPAPVAMRPVQPVAAPQPVVTRQAPAFARQYAWRPVNPPAGAGSVIPVRPTPPAAPVTAQSLPAGQWRPIRAVQPRQPMVGQWRPSQVAAVPQPAPTLMPVQRLPMQPAMPYMPVPAGVMPMPMPMPYPVQPYAGIPPYPQALMPMPQPMPIPAPVPGQAMNWQPYYPPYPGVQAMPLPAPEVARSGYYAGAVAGY